MNCYFIYIKPTTGNINPESEMYISSEVWQGLLGVVTSLEYLGQTLSSCDNNLPVVEQNLQKARGKWGRLAKILGREGADRRMTGGFMWRWCKWCLYLVPIHDHWSPGYINTWRISTTVWCGGWRSWAPKFNRMWHGCINPLGRCWQRCGWRIPGCILTDVAVYIA